MICSDTVLPTAADRQFNSKLAKSLKYRVRMYSTSHFMTAVRLCIRKHNRDIIKRVKANLDWALGKLSSRARSEQAQQSQAEL